MIDMSATIEWAQTSFDPTLLLPRPWAEDEIDPDKRGLWSSIHCADADLAAYVARCLNKVHHRGPAAGPTVRSQADLLTADEHKAMEISADLANIMGKIIWAGCDPDNNQGQAEHDVNEMAQQIHAIQRSILSQAAARAYPDKYRLLGGLIGPPASEEEDQPKGECVMPYIDGKRFACRCGVKLFTRVGNIYTCNGCGTDYEGSI